MQSKMEQWKMQIKEFQLYILKQFNLSSFVADYISIYQTWILLQKLRIHYSQGETKISNLGGIQNFGEKRVEITQFCGKNLVNFCQKVQV